MTRTTVATGWLAVAALLAAPAGGPAADAKSALDQSMQAFLAKKPGVGVVVAIRSPRGRQVYGYGKLAGTNGPPDGDTIFEIGSVTKVFTTLVLAEMVREGVVRLDDPVQPCLPEGVRLPRRGGRDITFLHLATHTSGLPVQPPEWEPKAKDHSPPKDWSNPYADYDRKRLAKSLAEHPLERGIGEKYEYSNLGVGVLGLALAHKANAASFEELVVKRVCDPLRMTNTRVTLSAGLRKRLAPGHDEKGKPASAWDFCTLEGCGALRSSADDLLRFVDMVLAYEPSPLRESVDACQVPRHDTDMKGIRVGLGWHLTETPGGKPSTWLHNGGTGGYRSFLAVVKGSRTGVVLLTNTAQNAETFDALGILLMTLVDSEYRTKQ